MIEGNWASLTDDQKNLIQEIGSGILKIVGLDKLDAIGETAHNIRKLSEYEKNEFKNKLIQEIKTVDNVDEEVLRAAAAALRTKITTDSMLTYREKESELLNKICESYSPSLSENRIAFGKLMEKILQLCSQNAEEIISPKKLSLATYDGVTEIRNTGATKDDLSASESRIIEKIDQIAAPASSTETEEKEATLKHCNTTYEFKFIDYFFLEEEMPEDEGICSLNNVFVEPVMTGNPALSLEKKLESWSADYDRTSSSRSDARYPVFLLYGKAGVGKSSYTAKIIYKNLFGKKWLSLELRSCAGQLKSDTAWESVKAIFGADDNTAYKNSILILDGLDEVCVLYPDFDGKVFIENLQKENALRINSIKILITSREGYFRDIEYQSNLLMDTIQWTEKQVGEWCEQYCKVHPSRKNWAEKFMGDYRELSEDDDRRAIFCIPIILYLCCVREIDIGSESTVVGIYEKAFRTVGERRHSETADAEMQMKDEHTFAVNWQYTKELAFRIFLDGESPTVLGNDGIQDAKEHTKKRFGECEPELDRYFALFPFASKKKEEGKPEGMEFAHKTVTDYFTAVKLYEDYFDKALEQADPVKALWEGLWRAFRYKDIPTDIMRYLAQVIATRQKKQYDDYCMKFFDCYYEGVKKQTIWQLLDEPEYACEMEYFQLPQQVGLVFRNLTYLLYCMNYTKFEKEPEQVYTNGISAFFQRGVKMDVRCYRWKGLRGADLRGADLRGASLRRASLSGADLNGAYLRKADLRGADLSSADLCGADLRGAYLRKADLRGADLSSADLLDADLSSADLLDADLSGAVLRYADLNGADLRGADLYGADLCGAYLWDVIWSENQALTNIRLWDTVLPQLDEAIKKYKIQLAELEVYSKETGKILKYIPETNRAEEW